MWFLLFLLMILLGYLTIARWHNDFHPIEHIIISVFLGPIVASLVFFGIGLLNIPFSPRNLFVSLTVSCLLFVFFNMIKRTPNSKQIKIKVPSFTFFELGMIIALALLFFWVLLQDVVWPPFSWDVLALYDFRGRVIADYHSLAQGFFTSQSNLTAYNYVYPFSTSILHGVIYITGGANPKFFYAFFYLGFVGLLYFCIRRYLSRLLSLFLTLFMAVTPDIIFPSTIAYPNIAYALLFSYSTIYFWKYMRYRKNGFLALSILLLPLSTWIRNSEPFWVINIIFMTIYFIKNRQILMIFAMLLIFFGIREIWPIYQGHIFATSGQIKIDPPQGFHIDLTKIPESFLFTIKYFTGSWWQYFLILFFAAISSWKKVLRSSFLIFWFISYLGISFLGTYFFAVSFSWWNQIGGSAERVSVFFAPLLLYLLAVIFPDTKNERFHLKIKLGNRIYNLINKQ